MSDPVTFTPKPDRRQMAARRSVPRGGRRVTDARELFESLVARIQEEYCEMPGLRLTQEQAAQLWHSEMAACECALDALVADGSLLVTPTGHYIAVPQSGQLRGTSSGARERPQRVEPVVF